VDFASLDLLYQCITRNTSTSKKEKEKKETDLLKLQFPEEVSTVMLGYQPNMALISAAQMWHSMY